MGDLFQVFDRLVSYVGICLESLQLHGSIGLQLLLLLLLLLLFIAIIIIIIIFYLLKHLQFNTYH